MDTKSKPTRVRVSEDDRQNTVKLFVYGIFLDELNRNRYHMTNPEYTTVKGFVTIGDYIVSAIRTDIDEAALTGLVVDIPEEELYRVDYVEAGYDRIIVNTTSAGDAFMYAYPGQGVNCSSLGRARYESEE